MVKVSELLLSNSVNSWERSTAVSYMESVSQAEKECRWDSAFVGFCFVPGRTVKLPTCIFSWSSQQLPEVGGTSMSLQMSPRHREMTKWP